MSKKRGQRGQVADIIEHIQQNLTEAKQLDAEAMELYQQMRVVDTILQRMGPGRKAVDEIMTTIEGVTHKRAYELIRETQVVFGAVTPAEKTYWANFAISKLVAQINAIDEERMKDPKWAAALVKLIEELRKSTGYDQADNELPEWDKLGQNKIVLHIDPTQLGIKPTGDLEAWLERIKLPKEQYLLGANEFGIEEKESDGEQTVSE
jgi:hypothetical protein